MSSSRKDHKNIMKNIIKNKFVLVGLLALVMILPAGLVSASSAPTVSYPSPAATSIASSSATLNATVNPNGTSTNIWFEVQGMSGALGSQNIGSGTSSTNVSYNVTGLTPGTVYSYRVVAVNLDGGTNGQYQNFTTTSVNKPSVSGVQATSITSSSATINAKVNPNGSTTKTWFQASNISGPVNNQNIGNGSADVSVSYSLTGLEADKTYTFRVEAVNLIGSTSSTEVSFKTLPVSNNSNNGAPTITTNSASSIDEDGATLNASYNSNGTAITYVRFAYGTSSNNLNNYTSYQTAGIGSGSYSRSISGLDEDTTYYFRAEAYNGLGGSSSTSPIQGSVQNFTTDDEDTSSASEPDISTDGASSITSTSAVLNALFEANGNDTFIRFDYGTSSSNLSSHTDYEDVGDDSGSFDEKVTGLEPNTTYYFRASGYNDEGSDNGSIYSFKTLASNDSYSGQYPRVTTKFVSNVGRTSVKLNGSATNSYNLPVKAWFEYGKTINLGSQTSKQSVGSGSSINFSADVVNLEANTIYYFRAIAENDGGQNKGEILVFKTGTNSTVSNTGSSNGSNTAVSVSTNGKAIALDIEKAADKMAPGEIIEYFINYKNVSDKEIKDIAIIVSLPKEIKLLKSSDGKLSEADNALVVKVAALGAGESRVLYIQGAVDENSQIRENVISSVAVSYKNAKGEKEDVLSYVVSDIVSSGSKLAAAAIFGEGGIIPNTVAEWIVLVIVIGALVYIGRKVYLDLEKKKMIQNAPDNLPR